MIIKNYFTHAKIKSFVRAGFFTRNGGVSKKENYSLNCSFNQKDTKVNVNKKHNAIKISPNNSIRRLFIKLATLLSKIFNCISRIT